MSKFVDSKVKICEEEWTVKYTEMLVHNNKYMKAIRIPSKKEIHISLLDEKGNKIPADTIVETFKKAALPTAIQWAKEKYGEEKVEEAIKEMQQ